MLKVALVGNQNSGKTSLFNALTGNNQKVGNWPGVTIDIAESLNRTKQFKIFDLPGIYSFSPYSFEEKISCEFILKEKIDLVINVLDATVLERSLYLTTRLLELDVDVIIVLNMYDIVKKQKIKIDIDAIEKELGVTILPISTAENRGIGDLVDTIIQKKYLKKSNSVVNKIYPRDVLAVLDDIANTFKDKKHSYFKAVQIFENDLEYCKNINDDSKISQRKNILDKFNLDAEELVAFLRYNYVSKNITCNFFSIPKAKNNLSDRIDKIVLNKFLAIPIFLIVMSTIFYISTIFTRHLLGSFIEKIFFSLSNFIKKKFIDFGISSIVTSFVLDGIIPGMSVIATIIPQITIFFFCLLVMESTGYVSRIAFSFDYLLHKLGLNGKSIIPFIVSMECTVSGIINTRTIGNDSERKKVIVLLPFIICNTKLAVIMFLISSIAFFNKLSFLFILLFYLESIIFTIFLSLIFKKIFFSKHSEIYVDELPTYKMANFRYIFRESAKKMIFFTRKIGTTILFFSIILWFLISFNMHFNFTNGNVDDSILANIGHFFSWFFYLMLGGRNEWSASVISLYGLIDKEQIISSIKIIGFEKISFLKDALASFAFLTFNLFTIPCFCTLSAISSELRSVKKVFFIMIFELSFAWIIATLIGMWGLFL
ncbi:MAG: ferrous iron transport protein B [Bacilli bacterium]|nr:ferrous iron transport protein B [Bacilli bacterium]